MTNAKSNTKYGAKFSEALLFATELHKDQLRKGTDTPYVTHLLSVAALVGESGGNETEVIAALLHDAVEDQGGAKTLTEIRLRFGSEVADIVKDCSDTDVVPKPPWKTRKVNYIKHLERNQNPSVLLVSCADKLHNFRCIVTDEREVGDMVWERFSASKEETLWYYKELLSLYEKKEAPKKLWVELKLLLSGR